MQVFLAVLARDYEWECNADEKWVTAENQRCADLPVAFACLPDRVGMLDAKFYDCANVTFRKYLSLMIA